MATHWQRRLTLISPRKTQSSGRIGSCPSVSAALRCPLFPAPSSTVRIQVRTFFDLMSLLSCREDISFHARGGPLSDFPPHAPAVISTLCPSYLLGPEAPGSGRAAPLVSSLRVCSTSLIRMSPLQPWGSLPHPCLRLPRLLLLFVFEVSPTAQPPLQLGCQGT